MDPIEINDKLEFVIFASANTDHIQEKMDAILKERQGSTLIRETSTPMPYTHRETGKPGTFIVKELWFTRTERPEWKKERRR